MTVRVRLCQVPYHDAIILSVGAIISTVYGCFYKLGVLFLGVLIVRVLDLGSILGPLIVGNSLPVFLL